MKKNSKRTLSLSTSTIRPLELATVAGGAPMTWFTCLTMGSACQVTYSALCPSYAC